MKKEIWKDIKGYKGRYRVSNHGRVFSIKRSRFLNIRQDSWGYSCCILCKDNKQKHFFVHRLVAAAFLGESSLIVNHMDRVKSNNCAWNLEYVSTRENINHRIKTRHLRGAKRCGKTKWFSTICLRGRRKHLGTFNTEVEAHSAYIAAARKVGQLKYAINPQE